MTESHLYVSSDSESVMYKLIVIFASILRFSQSATLENCPLTESEWRVRERMMNCSREFPYHCSFSFSGSPMEFCSTIKKYNEQGCPWAVKSGDKYYLGDNSKPCINNKYCPIEGKLFYSNELYKYPACLVREDERQNFTLPEPDDNIIINSSNQNQILSEESNTVTSVIIAIAVVMIVIVVSVLAVVIWKKWKGKKKKDEEEKYKKFSWEIEKIIEKDDNPKAVETLYEALKGMDKKNYKEYVRNAEGSFLMYAVKMNRRKTVLFFLQRQKDGLHVFEEDTYDAYKNSCVLDAAKEKEWSDVVDVLQGINDSELRTEFFNESRTLVNESISLSFLLE